MSHSSEQPFDYQHILVPLGDPSYAPRLLEFAAVLLEDGGEVLALHVTTDEQNDDETADALRAAVEQAAGRGLAIKWDQRHSASIARGILDAVREDAPDLTLLGIAPLADDADEAAGAQNGEKNGAQESRSRAGSDSGDSGRGDNSGGDSGSEEGNRQPYVSQTVQDVAEVCPTDLLLYRLPPGRDERPDKQGEPAAAQVMAVAGGGSHARAAVQFAAAVARPAGAGLGILNLRSDQRGARRARALTEHLPDDQRAGVEVEDAEELAGVGRETLLVLAFAGPQPAEQWLRGELTTQALRRRGPALIVHLAATEPDEQHPVRRFFARLAPVLTVDEQGLLSKAVEEMARPSTNYIVLSLIAAFIASLGMLADSAPVIIGAMIIAPLMSPLMGFGVGLATGRRELMTRSLGTTALGMALVLAVSFLLGLAAPLRIPTSEMEARSTPTVLDLGVAVAAGAAAAFTLARKDVSSALAGVAVAVALAPPLCTVGLALAFSDFELASGAGLLFALNLVGIAVAAFAVFAAMGLRNKDESSLRRSALLAITVLALLAVPLSGALAETVRRSRQLSIAEEVLSAALPDWEVRSVQFSRGERPRVTAVLRGAEAPSGEQLAAAQAELATRLEQGLMLEAIMEFLFTPADAPLPTPVPVPTATLPPTD